MRLTRSNNPRNRFRGLPSQRSLSCPRSGVCSGLPAAHVNKWQIWLEPRGSIWPREWPESARPSPSPGIGEGRQSIPAAVILRMRAGCRLWGHGLNIPQPRGTAALPHLRKKLGATCTAGKCQKRKSKRNTYGKPRPNTFATPGNGQFSARQANSHVGQWMKPREKRRNHANLRGILFPILSVNDTVSPGRILERASGQYCGSAAGPLHSCG